VTFGKDMNRRLLPLAVVLLVFGACASPHSTPPKADDQSATAVIKGLKSSLISDVLVPMGLHSSVNINIHRVDGKSVARMMGSIVLSYPYEITLPPGDHSVEVWCFGETGGMDFEGVETLRITVQAGHAYQLIPHVDRSLRVTVSIRDTVDDRKKGPNQAPEPTATLVTPRAFARVAPSAAVAHL
jgi:hypothetical protein